MEGNGLCDDFFIDANVDMVLNCPNQKINKGHRCNDDDVT